LQLADIDTELRCGVEQSTPGSSPSCVYEQPTPRSARSSPRTFPSGALDNTHPISQSQRKNLRRITAQAEQPIIAGEILSVEGPPEAVSREFVSLELASVQTLEIGRNWEPFVP
jgi:hypothetical protein